LSGDVGQRQTGLHRRFAFDCTHGKLRVERILATGRGPVRHAPRRARATGAAVPPGARLAGGGVRLALGPVTGLAAGVSARRRLQNGPTYASRSRITLGSGWSRSTERRWS
jgi:hypothetical protein